MRGIMYYCPVCANILTDSSEAKEIQIAEMKCVCCESELINTGKHMRDFSVYMDEHHVSNDEAIREIYAYDKPLFDKEKCDKRVAIETAYREEMNQLNREVDAMRRSGSNVPKCPTCGSTNIRHIGGGERAVSVIGLGLFSGKLGKNYECGSCKARW